MIKNKKSFIALFVLTAAILGCNASFNAAEYSEEDVQATLTAVAQTQQAEITPTVEVTPTAEEEVADEEEAEENSEEVAEQVAIVPQEPAPANNGGGSPELPCVWDAAFVADVSVPDGSVIEGGTPFTKTWGVSNSGCQTWAGNVEAVYASGSAMNGPASVLLDVVIGQNGTADISVDLVAPEAPGTYQVTYRLRNPEGELFGTSLYAEIVVPEPEVEETPEPEEEEPEEEETPEPEDDDDGWQIVPGIFACTLTVSFPNGSNFVGGGNQVPLVVKNTSNCDWESGAITIEYVNGFPMLPGGKYTVPNNQLLKAGQQGVVIVPLAVAPKPHGAVDVMTFQVKINGVAAQGGSGSITYVH